MSVYISSAKSEDLGSALAATIREGGITVAEKLDPPPNVVVVWLTKTYLKEENEEGKKISNLPTSTTVIVLVQGDLKTKTKRGMAQEQRR